VDGTDERAFAGFVADLLARHQRLDVLVNTVGGFAGGDLASTSLAEWRRILDLNLTSAVIGCRTVLPAMRAARRGRIVNVASRAVVPPLGGFIAYTVSKSAVIALTQALAQEERPHGIAVNAVLPSTMDTPPIAGPCPTPTAPTGSAPTRSPTSSRTSPRTARPPCRARAWPCDCLC